MSDDSSKPKKLALAEPAVPNQYRTVSWGPLRGVLFSVTALLLGQLLAAGVFMAVGIVLHTSSAKSLAWMNTTKGQFVYVVMAEALTVSVLWSLLRRRKNVFKAVGLGRGPVFSDVAYTIAAAAVYVVSLVALTAIVGSLFHLDVKQHQELGFDSVIGVVEKLITFISLVLLPPFVEEVLFRGVLFGGLRTRLKWIYAALITSAIFAVPHLLQGATALLWIGALDTFVLSMVLCYLREKTGSLWSGILLHMLKNGTAFIFLYIVVSK